MDTGRIRWLEREGALALVAGIHWKALFLKVGGRDVLLMVGFAILNVVVTLVIGFLFVKFAEATANEAVAGLADQSTAAVVVFYVRSTIQLLGEEVMTILPRPPRPLRARERSCL